MMELIAALIDLGAWNLIGLVGIVLIGLPHGALDGAVAMHLGIVQRFSDLARFMLVYIALAALVVVTWTVAPSISLILFLTISMLHFGAGDVKNGKGSLGFTEALAHGGLAIVGISQFHRSEVNEIFAYLTNQDTAAVWLAVDILTVGVILAIITCVFQASKNPKWATTILELLLLGIVYALAPPLLGFAIYFCCVHSARHFRKIYATIKETVASGNIKNQADTIYSHQLDSCPTVPHMILIDGIMKVKLLDVC